MAFTSAWMFPENDTCEPCAEKIEKTRAAEAAARSESRLREAEESRLKLMLKEKGFAEFHLSKFKVTSANQKAFDACKNFDPTKESLFLFGPAGTGKTHLAASVARLHVNGFFIQHAALNRSMQGLKSEEYEARLEIYLSHPVMAVDDLGTAKQTEYADQVLYEILDGRLMAYRHGMIITSNLNLNDLAKRFGDDRLTSRISGMCKIVWVGGSDRRLGEEN